MEDKFANHTYNPEIRFRGYTDGWEQRKLGELSSSFEYGLNAASKEYDGENKYIRITDIDDESREFKQEDITSPDTDLSSAENYKLSEGDILFARTGASVGKSYIYKASDGLVYYAGFLIRARIKPEYNSEFVFQNTLTGNYEKFIKVTSMRSGQPGVNAQEYSQYQIMMPSKPEQDKISDCLRNLDNLITFHQRKCNTLKNLKEAMFTKMFPKEGESVPEIRFKGFTDPWEQRKLNEICDYTSSSLTASSSIENGKYILYDANTEIGSVDSFSMNEDYITVIKDGAGVGRIRKLPKNTAFIGTMGALTSKNKETDFLYYLLERKDLSKQFTGSTIPHIYFKDYGKDAVNIPKDKEQQVIGSYFKQLDNLITLHQRKYEKLLDVKKAFLEKMIGGDN